MSVASAPPSATDSTRSMVAKSGGWLSRSQARSARRPMGGRRLRDRLGIGRVEGGGELSQKIGVIGHQPRLTGENRDDVAAGELAERGQQLMANAVAQIDRVGVAGVFHRAQTELCAQGMGLGPAQPQNRVPRSGAHRRKAVGGRAAEEIEEDGLGLVVGGVAGSSPWR